MFRKPMLKLGNRSGQYTVTRQNSSSDESDDEETSLGAGEGGFSEDEEEEEVVGEQAEDPPLEDSTEAPESASNDEGASPAGVSMSVEMNVVHPLPTTTAGEEIGTTPGDIPLDVINDSSTSTPLETAADGVSTPQEEVEDELEETVLDAALPTYNKLNGKDVAPPDYESAVQMEDSRAAKNYLQAPSSSSAADGGAAMELSVMAGEEEERPRSVEAWASDDDDDDEDGGDADNVANEDIEARRREDSADDVSVPDFIPDPLRPAFRQVRMFRPGVKTAIITVVNFGIALFLLLMILSIQKLDYIQMGFKMKRVSHFVYREKVFDAGRYFIGPRNVFKPYPSIAHSMEFEEIRIYTTDPLRISFHCHFHFFLKKTELGLLEDELDRYYLETIEKASISALKNAASQFSIDEFLEERSRIESFIHRSLQNHLEGTCCLSRNQCKDFASCHECYAAAVTNCTKGFHIEVPFFNLLMVHLPEAVLERRQQVLITALGGEEEVFHQRAALTRKTTQKLEQDIRNEAALISANATAHAAAIRRKANAQADAVVNEANSHGLTNMFGNLSITEEDHKASVYWLRTLRNHPNLLSGMDFEEYLKLTRGSQ